MSTENQAKFLTRHISGATQGGECSNDFSLATFGLVGKIKSVNAKLWGLILSDT